MHVFIVAMALIAFFLIIAVIVVVILIVSRQQPPAPVVPITEEGVDVANLPEISGLPCCIVNGRITDTTYMPTYDFVVSSVPTPYGVACAGFTDQTQLNVCLALARPSEPGEVASPVARRGLKLYYVLAAGQSLCPTTGMCAVTI
jgi:hypothetical protein